MNALFLLIASFAIATSSCNRINGNTKLDVTGGTTKASEEMALNPPVASPGTVVTITGTKFDPSRKYLAHFTAIDGTVKEVQLVVKDTSTATFVMPAGLGLGQTNLSLLTGNKSIAQLQVISDQSTNTLPIITADAGLICSSVTYLDKNGTKQTGTKDCSAATAACTADGSVGCVTTASFPSASATTAIAANIKSGVVVAGVTGTLVAGATANCTSDGQVGCVTTASFKSADMSIATVGNIKSGVAIAGVTGQFPNGTYTLAGATATADLDSATFNAKIKAATAFEWWDSAGTRYTGAGDTNITAGNIQNSVTIFGTTGTYTGTAPNAWDLRVGVTAGGVTGKLKVNCRSGANLATFDQSAYPIAATIDNTTDTFTATAHGFTSNQTVRISYNSTPGGLDYATTYYVRNETANTFQVSLTSGGAAINITSNGSSVFVYRWGNGTTEIWDSIDDYAGYASSIPTYTGWSSNNVCGGIEATTGDANVWSDVTTTGDGVTASTCTASAANCSYKDKISGQEWHNADNTNRTWSAALSYCDNLTYNGKTDWRLPTEKEILEANTHGIMSTAGATNWISLVDLRSLYWSATSSAAIQGNAWQVSIGTGDVGYDAKYSTIRVICVRP